MGFSESCGQAKTFDKIQRLHVTIIRYWRAKHAKFRSQNVNVSLAKLREMGEGGGIA